MPRLRPDADWKLTPARPPDLETAQPVLTLDATAMRALRCGLNQVWR